MSYVTLSELVDRYTIALLKVERLGSTKEWLNEVEAYKGHLEDKYETLKPYIKALYKINAFIWNTEWSIRAGLLDHNLQEMGRVALRVRELNDVRNRIKNRIIIKFGGYISVRANTRDDFKLRRQNLIKDGEGVALVFGSTGLAGSAFVRAYRDKGYRCIELNSKILNLETCSIDDILAKFLINRPNHIIMGAAFVGGINANMKEGYDFLFKNTIIAFNILEAYRRYKSIIGLADTCKLLFLGSSCIYPKIEDRLIKEEDLLTGELEKTNDCYAISKIAGLRLAQELPNTFCVMPPNLIGENDQFNLERAHVAQSIMIRMLSAKAKGENAIPLGGRNGTCTREFLLSNDLADFCIALMETYQGCKLVNCGPGHAHSIMELYEEIARIVGYTGGFIPDNNMATGVLQKTMCPKYRRKLLPNWEPLYDLRMGLQVLYNTNKDRIQRELEKKPL